MEKTGIVPERIATIARRLGVSRTRVAEAIEAAGIKHRLRLDGRLYYDPGEVARAVAVARHKM